MLVWEFMALISVDSTVAASQQAAWLCRIVPKEMNI